MKITRIFITGTIFIITFFLGSNFAQADEVTGSVTVIAGVCTPTVDVKVRPINGTESDGPITLNTGNNVQVTWFAENIPSGQVCNCRCMSGTTEIDCGSRDYPFSSDHKSCGSGLDTTQYPVTIYGLLRPTTFKVTCQP